MAGSVLVMGDLVVAWDLLLPGHGQGNSDTAYDPEELFDARRCSAGALHVANVLRCWMRDEGGAAGEEKVLGPLPPPSGGVPATRVYNAWAKEPIRRDRDDLRVFRLKTFLGTELAAKPEERIEPATVPAEPPRLVVITDDDMGYRKGTQGPRGLLEKWAGWEPKPWIIWKYRHPSGCSANGDSVVRPTLAGALAAYGEGAHALPEGLLDRAVAIVSADTLRQQGARVSRNRSWEDVSSDALRAVQTDAELRAFRWVIVSFGTAGAIVVSRDSGTPSSLLFDASCLEGDWERDYPGKVVGYTSCVLVHVVRGVYACLSRGEEPDATAIEDSLAEGLRSVRTIQRLAYHAAENAAEQAPAEGDKYLASAERATHPTTAALLMTAFRKDGPPEEKARDASSFARVELSTSAPPMPFVVASRSLLKIEKGKPTRSPIDAADILAVARSVVKQGTKDALKEHAVPHVSYGKLRSVDPDEIGGLRALHLTMGQYLHARSNDDRPLSVAVFGPPGSGKSFAVKEIAKSLGLSDGETLTFNLSQLDRSEMLVGALHQVRDHAFRRKVPLVFWDEFDTSLARDPLGWLRYFLAPMQDGEFQEGQSTHPLGRAIFVFAGGTCESYSEFQQKNGANREAKVPDFVSRLRGFLDVRGVNPKQASEAPGAVSGYSAAAEMHVLRRAMLLRSSLDRFGSKETQISEGVLQAFLRVPRYLHGARSMEAIVRSSMLRGVRELTVSDLPSRAQLQMHVDDPGWFLDAPCGPSMSKG